MISVLLYSIIAISLAQRKTAICDIEQFLDLNMYEEILDHARINSTDVILTNQNIFFLDEDLNLLNTLPSPQSGKFVCDKVAGHSLSNNTFLVACQSKGANPYFVAYRSVNGNNFEVLGDYQYVSTINQTFSKIDIVGNTLLIPQPSKVVFFTIVLQASSWYLRTTTYVLDTQFFDRTSLNITDFSFKSYLQDQQLYYKLFVIDYNDGILWVDAISRTNNLIPYNFGSINVKNQFYIPSGAKFRSSVILDALGNYTQFVIQTYLDGSFQFENYGTTQLHYKLALNEYRDWNPISSIRTADKVIAIPYQNYQNTVVINLFNIQLKSSENLAGQDPNDLLISGSIDNLIFYFISDSRLVYRSDYDSLTRCKISNYKIE